MEEGKSVEFIQDRKNYWQWAKYSIDFPNSAALPRFVSYHVGSLDLLRAT